MDDNDVIDIVPEEVIIEDVPKVVARFVGDHLSLNVHHIAYVLNIIGVNVPTETYEKMPEEVKKHFVLVRV